MAVSLNSTGVTFSDATTQSTAAVASTTFDAIGSVGYFCYYSASVLAAGGTVAGSSLYYVSTVVANVTDQNGLVTNGSISSGTNTVYSGSYATRSRSGTAAGQVPPLGMTTLSGTWRAMNAVSRSAAYNVCCTANNTYSAGVFMRVS
jgi:hypothetical protein